MTEQNCAPQRAHPLELIPFFRRWPQAWPHDILYTVIWSCLMALPFTGMSMLFGPESLPVTEHLWPILIMSLLIGAMIHGGLVVANHLLSGWPSRARGLPRLLFSMTLMSISVLFGISVGNLIWKGVDPIKVLKHPGILMQALIVAAIVAFLMYLVRKAAERRAALAVAEAQQKEFAAASARMLAEARLRALQAQIEPHFLYNTLANVVSLIGPQPARAQNMLERFIDYLRASLAASRSDEVTLASESTLIAAYLDVLAVRMGERLRYRIDVPDELRHFRIAPMLLQPVVENAIAHGLEPKVEGGEIVVSARIEGEHVAVRISDTGAGLNENAPRKPGGGVGLSNLRERLRSLYGPSAKVELLENNPCGMTVRLMLPLNASPTSIPSVP
ncbi:sensor histidine kinase [Duganella sp. FT50W]|uniref:Sensor histidine kinase n=1 Tax=Duganella lactea TaxID=2692173 RepID=A0A6L8MKH5_9BURK|nr:histidine kinase [Duganella lactea]MYM80945.1 sensor histidine kinase [Duganella lactea]